MRAKTRIKSRRVLVISSLMALSLLWSTTHAEQKPGKDEDQQVVVSRKALRHIASQLLLVRDSVSKNLGQLEGEYLRARGDGVKPGEPKEKAIRGELERQREDFHRLVDQLKQLQRLAETSPLPPSTESDPR